MGVPLPVPASGFHPDWLSRNGGQRFFFVAHDAPLTGALAVAAHHLGQWRHSEVNQDLGRKLLKNPKAGECGLGR